MEYMIEKPVPYIEEYEGKFEVVFIEPGTSISTYEFNNLRDAKICANEVMDLVKASGIERKMISKEIFEVEPLVNEIIDEYGFKTVTTTPWKEEPIVEIFDEEGKLITAEEKEERINKILEEKALAEEVKEEVVEELDK